MNTNPVIYIMDCGCRRTKAGLILRHNPYHFTCPEHRGARISHKETICPQCGVVVEFHRRSSQPNLCKKCAYELALKKAKERKAKGQKKIYPPKDHTLIAKQIRASRENYNCVNRDACLTETVKANPNAEALGCYECEFAIGNQRRCA